MALKLIRRPADQKPNMATPPTASAYIPERMQQTTSDAAKPSMPRNGETIRVKGVGRILDKELIPFTKQLASMSAAGMPILPVLETLRDQCVDVNFKMVLEKVTEAVEGGAPLSDGLAKFPQIFDDSYINLVVAGEQSGKFADILKRVSVMMQNAARLRRKVKSAMTYPTVIVSIAMLMAAGLIQFVVPIFAGMFSGFGKELPWLTQQLVDISDGVKHWWYIILPSVVGAVWMFLKWKNTPAGRMKFDTFMLKVPVFGMLNQKSLISRFSRIFAEMLNAGVPVLNAMKIVAAALDNRVIQESILAARREVEQGNQLSLSLNEKPYLPILMTRMIAAGEKAGRVEDMLISVADTYDEEVESMLATLTSLMEPFLMIFLGAVIGTIVAAMFLPIFNMGALAS